jgi:hypothetical protein
MLVELHLLHQPALNGLSLRVTDLTAGDEFDQISREPNYKQCAVRVRGQL